MSDFLCSDIYIEFRGKIQGSSTTTEEVAAVIREAISPIAEALNVGFIGISIMNPSDRTGQNGAIGLYQSEQGFEYAALVETIRTGDNSIISFSANPRKGHKFNENEIKSIRLLANDISMSFDKARLLTIVQKARFSDTLTGIPNTLSLMQKGLELKIARELRLYNGAFINLKNYKYINNTMGGAAGDMGIITYANAMMNYLSDKGYAARLGGDNFFAIVKKEFTDEFVQKFSNFDVTVDVGKIPHKFTIRSRMGIYSTNATDAMGDIMHGGSIALNIAKNVNGTDILYFSPKMLEKSMHEKQISATFQSAYNNHEFVVYYQPKIRVEDRKLYGCEALVRWNMGDRIAPPAEFLPILEKESAICQLDFYVFETVCADIRSWLNAGITPVKVSSNFSKLHLKNKFLADDILAIMKKHNIESKYIEIELTEVSDFEDSMAMQSFVNKMREKGISVSIDDFGNGYSTLNVLTNFDVDVIKLDKSLLEHIGEGNEHDKIVLKNMVSMMQELNKEVVAEGVETDTQLEFLKGIKCALAQGFAYDKPLPRSEFEKRLVERRTY